MNKFKYSLDCFTCEILNYITDNIAVRVAYLIEKRKKRQDCRKDIQTRRFILRIAPLLSWPQPGSTVEHFTLRISLQLLVLCFQANNRRIVSRKSGECLEGTVNLRAGLGLEYVGHGDHLGHGFNLWNNALLRFKCSH